MTDQEWLAYQDRLRAIAHPTGDEIADALGAMLERLSTIITSYVNRQHDDMQRHERRIAKLEDATRPRERQAGE